MKFASALEEVLLRMEKGNNGGTVDEKSDRQDPLHRNRMDG